MTVTFYGTGSAYISGSRRFVRFIGGKYSTSDETEIAVLSKTFASTRENDIPERVEKEDMPVEVKRGRKPKNA